MLRKSLAALQERIDRLIARQLRALPELIYLRAQELDRVAEDRREGLAPAFEHEGAMHGKEKELLVVAAALGLFAGSAGAGILSYWSFNDNDGDLYTWPADMSHGTLTLDSDWTNLSTAPGTDLNRQWGFPAGEALELRGNGNNGRRANFRVVNTTEDLSFSFDIMRNNPGFGANQIWYSVNGGNFHLYSNFTPESSYSTMFFDLSTLTEVNYADELVLQIRFNGASNNGGHNRIDNVLIGGLPAPGTLALLGLAGLMGTRRRHK